MMNTVCGNHSFKSNFCGKRKIKKRRPLGEKSFRLAVRVVKLCRYLRQERQEYELAKQLLKAGTNPDAMVREAGNAESGLDFIHKLGVAQKELGETMYWLELFHASDILSENEFSSIYADTEEVMRLVRSSILTKKKNLGLLGEKSNPKPEK